MLGRFARIGIGAVCSLLAYSGTAQAAEDGFYIGAAAGVNFAQDSKFDLTTGSDPSASHDTGLTGLASGGYKFESGLRLEAELGYRDSDVDEVGGVDGDGDVSAISLMGNALYDFDLGSPITPYIGIGLGIAQVDFDGVSPVGGSAVDDDDTSIAYQGIAGASLRLTDQLDLTLDYRYFAAPDVELSLNSGGRADSSYKSHNIMLGLRFSFGAPAPAATPVQAPAPAPAPAPEPEPAQAAPTAPVVRNFLVFFDWDRSELTPEALSIIASAAEAAQQAAPIRIELTGHADRSGPRPYNQGLSQRRGDAVAAELVRLGIAPAEIGISARGEDDPLVPTPDGVREPQNRRVEIVLE